MNQNCAKGENEYLWNIHFLFASAPPISLSQQIINQIYTLLNTSSSYK